jgi:hypothetical protein
MSNDLTRIIHDNQRSPDAFIEKIPPHLFNLPQNCAVSIYPGLETLALAAGVDAAALAGLIRTGPAPCRHTLLASPGDGASWSVIACTPCTTGARDQVRSMLERAVVHTPIAGPADIGENRVLLFSLNGGLTLSARLRLRFALHWLREIAAGTIDGGLGAAIDSGVDASVRATLSGSFLAAIALDEECRLRLRIFGRSASGLVVKATPLPEIPEPLAGSFPDLSHAAAANLAKGIWEKALAALEKTCAADLSWRWRTAAPGCALLDCSFDFTAEGLAAYRAALAGNFDGTLLGQTALVEALQGERTIQVHLPFLDRKEWPARSDTLARAETVAEEDGHVFVHTAGTSGRERRRSACQITLALAGPLLFPRDTSRFELTFTDRRTAPRAHLARALPSVLRACEFGDAPWHWLGAVPDGEVEASLSLSVPGNLVGAWLRAPGETVPAFFEVFSKVAIAIQRASRRWLPYVYFSDLDRYEELRTAYPLVFYQSTRPFSGRPRSDFAYDLVGPDYPGVARPWAFRPLVSELARVHQVLIDAGRPKLARMYETWRAREIVAGIARQPRLINALLTNDAFLIDRFVNLGLEGRELSARLATDPHRAAKELTAFASHFAVTLHRKLRRIYARWGFEAFGSLLLVEATRALATALDGSAAMAATLRLSAGGRQQTFTARSGLGGVSWPSLPC